MTEMDWRAGYSRVVLVAILLTSSVSRAHGLSILSVLMTKPELLILRRPSCVPSVLPSSSQVPRSEAQRHLVGTFSNFQDLRFRKLIHLTDSGHCGSTAW